jgi:hypothetical protein
VPVTQQKAETSKDLLALLPADGSPRTNAELRTALDVEVERYWLIRAELIEQGLVVARRGRGGSTARVVDLESFSEAESHRWPVGWRVAEFGAYLVALGSLSWFVVLIFLELSVDSPGFLIAFFSLSVTAFGSGVAVTIYRLQTLKQAEDRNAQGLLAQRLTVLTRQTAQSTADIKAGQDRFIADLRGGSQAGSVQPHHLAETTNGEIDLEPDEDEPISDAVGSDLDVIQVEGDGEYRRPATVPIRLLAYLVLWWEQSAETRGQWTIGNLVGAYRPYDKNGALRGVPWILTFRRSNGTQQEYRIVLTGKKSADGPSRKATVSLWAEEQHKWVEGKPLSLPALDAEPSS